MNKKFFDDIPVFTPVSQAGAHENEPVPPEEDDGVRVVGFCCRDMGLRWCCGSGCVKLPGGRVL
jgi:hypothetical protein